MKSILLYTFLVFGALISFGADTPIEINLLDGSRIKGRVMSVTASTSRSTYKNLLPADASSEPLRTTFHGALNPKAIANRSF